jgi:hypothetical protein
MVGIQMCIAHNVFTFELGPFFNEKKIKNQKLENEVIFIHSPKMKTKNKSHLLIIFGLSSQKYKRMIKDFYFIFKSS